MPVASFRLSSGCQTSRVYRIGCPRLHFRLYSIVMRAHGLDEPQMITLFPLSLSGAAQRWFARIDERARGSEAEDRGVRFFFHFPWRGKIAEIVDRPLEIDQIQMVLRSLQPGSPDMWWGPCSQILGIWLWLCMMSRTTSREMLVLSVHPVRGFRRHQPSHSSRASFVLHTSVVQATGTCPTFDQTYQAQPLALLTMPLRASRASYFIHGHWTSMLRCTVHSEPAPSYPSLELSRPLHLCFEDAETVFTNRHAIEPGSWKLIEAGLLTALTPRPLPQPFQLSSGWIYTVLIIRGLDMRPIMYRSEARYSGSDRPGFGTLGSAECDHKPVTDPHHTCSPPPADGIHFLDFDEIDDHVHMLSWDDSDPEPQMLTPIPISS
ncbi:hypothetical protein CK203_016255 [Vitis vinifera]|uniref:Retrotransposon gag domain-containing protein n=1 Tax=Vitis vinifera TaxID=29760 RepID=A0A438JMR2_VITVI|nr:hypothetical protein CK203_016255 [Vitis vinifera]